MELLVLEHVPREHLGNGDAFEIPEDDMVLDMLEKDREWAEKSFDFRPEHIAAEARAYASYVKRHCYRLLDNFLA